MDLATEAYQADQIRDAEAAEREGRPPDVLMQRAAAGLATSCVQALRRRRGRTSGARVVILVGSGDNGGDALLAGARLRARGMSVDALLIASSWYEPGQQALNVAGGRCLVVDPDGGDLDAARQLLSRADLVLDGIVGLRGQPGLTKAASALVSAIAPSAIVVAVDLPSGVDPHSGETPAEHVTADLTVTFGALKPCHLIPPAAHAAGLVEFIDVGLASRLPREPVVRRLTGADARRLWPVPRRTDHKYTRGVLGVIAGSVTYPGAAVMTCMGAVQAGAGVVKYVGPFEVAAQIIAVRPEVEARGSASSRVGAWVIGSGVADDPRQDEAIETVLDAGLPYVVDAGALEACVLARLAGRRATPGHKILMTPHAGELSRLLGLIGEDVPREAVEARPWHFAQTLARRIDATVLIKGPTTLIVPPSGVTYSQADGPAWLATAGSGDVLAGIAGSLLASGLDAPIVGALAAQVHGRAGHRASSGGPAPAANVANHLPGTIADLLSAPDQPQMHDPSRRHRADAKSRSRRRQ